MLSASGNCNCIKDFEKVETKVGKKSIGSALLWVEFRPFVINGLCHTENIFDGIIRVKQAIDVGTVSLISQRELVFEVVEAVVYRSS